MIGYPFILSILNKIIPSKKIDSSMNYLPKVSVIVPAHNEEKVISDKIKNLLELDYPRSLFEIIVSSDNSTDNTNKIVESFVKVNENLLLHKVETRKGKTNAQDEAVKKASGDILIFTDANSLLDKNSLKELVSYFNDESIGYVAGKLVYRNGNLNPTSNKESTYWSIDLWMRQIESNISSITAGNGSLYAVRKLNYFFIDPVYSHDSIYPPKMVISGKRAVYNEKAITTEKAGQTDIDEFKRKIRMSRKIIAINFTDIEKYNFFRYGWFSFFYFSHRTLRNNLFLFHLIVFISNIFILDNLIGRVLFLIQIFLYAIYVLKIDLKGFGFVKYYILTIHAQLIGALREITGKSKPFWEKAESTR
jgi:glycosyltransferase involved in cell wall biosynthesis